MGNHIKVFSRFGGLSRGKCWARQGRGAEAQWAEKSGAALLLTPGSWSVGSDDGFSRKDRGDVVVSEDGTVEGLPRGWSVSEG